MDYTYIGFGVVTAVTVMYMIMVLLRRSSIKLKNIESKFYNALIRFPYHAGGFDNTLGFPRNILKEIKYKKGLLKVDYQVPHSICVEEEGGVEDKSTRRMLTLGGALALGDSLTTLVMMTDDSLHRPGVSVSLSGNMVDTTATGATKDNTIYAGDVINIVCRTNKVGATIGFSEAFFCKNRRVLAHVRHIKYLKMGYLFDNWVGPLLPLFFDISCMMSHNGSLRPTKKAALKRLSADCDVLLENSLNLGETAAAADEADTTDAQTLPKAAFSAMVHKGVENPFGSLHGGAVACIANEAALRTVGDAGTHKDVQVTAMEIDYLSAAKKGKMDIRVDPVMVCGGFTATSQGPVQKLDKYVAAQLEKDLATCEICSLDDLIVGEERPAPVQADKTKASTPPAKGVCSSSVMNVALKKAISTSSDKPGRKDPEKVYANCKVTISVRT